MKVGSQKLLYNAEQYGMYLTEALSTTSIDTNQYGTNIPLLRTNISECLPTQILWRHDH